MSNHPSRLATIFSELRRRRVFRVAAVYAGVAFIIFQIVDATFDYLPIPDWVGTTLIVVLLLGFPIAVGLAWAFDITEQGVVRTAAKEEAAEAKAPPRPLIGNKTLAIVAVMAVIAAVWSWWGRPAPAGPITSIAVLPLENLMGDPDQDYFVDGMHDALISELGKISALRVISRTSVMQYKAAPKPLPEIARELGVDAVVEGSVLRVGDRVKITAQLMGTAPERHLWTDDYTRDLRDILALQSEVARAIAKEIKVTLTPEEEASLTEVHSVNPEAHELYLMGWFFLKKGTQEAVEKAIGYFQQALEEDPDYALAYSGLANAYNLIGNFALFPPRETSPKAKTLALKALEIDERLAEAYAELGWVKMNYDWDWAGAESANKRAVELNPGYWYAHILYAWYSAALGRFDEALVKMKPALKLDPLSIVINWIFGWHLYMARRYDKAIVQLRKAIDMDPTYAFSYYCLGMVYEQKRICEEAIEEFQKAIALSDSMTTMIAALGHAYAASDKRGEAQRVISKLQKLSKQKYVSSYDMAVIYTGLGEKDQVFAWLEKAYEQRDGWLAGWIKIDPRFDPLRDDPHFQDLLRRMNFPE